MRITVNHIGRQLARLLAPALLAAAGLHPDTVAAASERARAVVELTGHRTKIVWIRGSRDSGGSLMCFDTDEGEERNVVPDKDKCQDPKLTPDGSRILFNYPDETGWIVNWDGSGLRQLFAGRHHYILGVAQDPKTGVEWVYAGDNMSAATVAELKERGSQASEDSGLTMFRHRLDDLSVKALVWDKVPFNRRTEVSVDGARIWGEFPWPNCGVAELPNGEWKLYAQGCNANLAPDGSGLFFNLIGDHRNLRFYNPDGSPRGGNVAINTMPGIEKDPQRKVWRPRWSNRVRYFAVQSGDTGSMAEIVIGKFDEDFTAVESWVRITDTDVYNADSVLWIDPRPPLGEKLTDYLDAPLLDKLVRELEAVPRIRPVGSKLAVIARDKSDPARAAEAERIIRHVKDWIQAQCERLQALETSDPAAAAAQYRALAARLEGLPQGAAVQARLEDPRLRKELGAWRGYEKLCALEERLHGPPGVPARVTEAAWLAENRETVEAMRKIAAALAEKYAETAAWARAREVLARYGVDGDTR